MKSSREHVLFCFLAKKQLVLIVGQGGGEEVEIAPVFQLQALPQLGHRHGEITHGDIGSVDASEGGFQFTLVHRSGLLDDETTAWEIADIMVGHKQMAVLIELLHAELLLQRCEATGFHDGGIGLEEEVLSVE